MKIILLWAITALLIVIINDQTIAQQSWVMQDIQPSMSGTHLYKSGDNCVIHTRSSSRFVYFFDVNSKIWSECDLGWQQNIIAIEAGSNVAFAYSDSLLIAYSSLTSSYQYITYSGNIISPQGTVSGTRGFGCGENAVYVFTDQNILYVFDGLIGEWRFHNYGEILNATGGRSLWCGDKYVSGIFHRYYPDKHRNVVYSLVTGTFNQTDLSGVYYASADGIAMTGGFVSSFGGGGETALLTGYSAFTNEFYTVEEIPPYGTYVLGSGEEENWSNCSERNVFGYVITRGDAQSRDLKINTFDTQRSEWITYTSAYSPSQTGGPSNYYVGGNTSITSMYSISGPVTFYIYSGISGTYNIYTTGILYNLHPYYYSVGSQSAMVLDDWNNGWFQNSTTGFTQSITFGDSNKVSHQMYVDYGFFFRYSEYKPNMDLWFYNSNKDRLSKVELAKYITLSSSIRKTPHSFVFKNLASNDEVVFYSVLLDSTIIVNSSLAGFNSSGVFSWVNSSSSSLLFDAANLNLIDIPAVPASNVKSDSLMLFSSGNIIYVYDASNKQLSTLDLGGAAGYRTMNGNVILISNSNYSNYFAFQKKKTTWTELLPEGGNNVGVSVGKNTALVVRQNKLYAFAPDGLTNIIIEETEFTSPVNFELYQNYPNPFNPSTVISYQLPVSGNVMLKVYDILGNEIAKLVDEYKPAGRYDVEFNLSAGRQGPVSGIRNLPDGRQGLASGIYFYQLKVVDPEINSGKSFIQTKKMILLK